MGVSPNLQAVYFIGNCVANSGENPRMDDASQTQAPKEANHETENVHTAIPTEPDPFCWEWTGVMFK
jgi:hypothetical protein